MNEDGEYTILRRQYIERGCRIAELESKVKQLQTVTPESCSVLEEENQRLKAALENTAHNIKHATPIAVCDGRCARYECVCPQERRSE